MTRNGRITKKFKDVDPMCLDIFFFLLPQIINDVDIKKSVAHSSCFSKITKIEYHGTNCFRDYIGVAISVLIQGWNND